ncbi:MAG: peptidylprolyl isomerase [Planctomycetota bacterium]|nr:peptidylprolyl isomerase [Planctomycetota bacterium]
MASWLFDHREIDVLDLLSSWYATMLRGVLLTLCGRWVEPGRRQAFVLWLVAQFSQVCYCEKQPGLPSQQQQESVAARVNGQPILVREVTSQLRRFHRRQPISAVAAPHMKAEVLRQLIQRRLVQLYLHEQQLAASQQEVAVAVDSLKSRLSEQKVTLADHLVRQHMTETELRADLAWQIGWRRYLDRHLTEANLKQYFRQHVRDFDGTKMRVAHILFKCSPDVPSKQQALLHERAAQLGRRIRAGEVSFAAAARRYSDAPTASQGGDIGVIQRNEPMPDAFTKVAFALQVGQVGGPVRTRFGIHLIQCLEVTAGPRKWSEVRSQVREAVTRYLFGWAADQQSRTARVVWTGVIPQPISAVDVGGTSNRSETTDSK